MAAMPFLSQQDKGMDTGGYSAYKLSALLPQVQEGTANKCETISYRAY